MASSMHSDRRTVKQEYLPNKRSISLATLTDTVSCLGSKGPTWKCGNQWNIAVSVTKSFRWPLVRVYKPWRVGREGGCSPSTLHRSSNSKTLNSISMACSDNNTGSGSTTPAVGKSDGEGHPDVMMEPAIEVAADDDDLDTEMSDGEEFGPMLSPTTGVLDQNEYSKYRGGFLVSCVCSPTTNSPARVLD